MFSTTLTPNARKEIEMSSNNVNDFLGFNPHETEAAESFEGRQEPIPNGTYKAVATSAARKEPSANKVVKLLF
jgi:hypothetical protein